MSVETEEIRAREELLDRRVSQESWAWEASQVEMDKMDPKVYKDRLERLANEEVQESRDQLVFQDRKESLVSPEREESQVSLDRLEVLVRKD